MMTITREEIAGALRIGVLCLIVGAVFSIAHGRALLGIAEFLAAEAGLLAIRKAFGAQEADAEQRQSMMTVIGCASILISFLGVVAGMNHVLNTGESLIRPACIALLGAATAWAALRKAV